MLGKAYSVMFLCDTNSARSLMAEAILRREGAGRFNVYSSGSKPKSTPHRETTDLLACLNHDVADRQPKSWSRFSDAAAGTGFLLRLVRHAPDNPLAPLEGSARGFFLACARPGNHSGERG